jgi:LysR family transcriptional regulator, carnitine catabolism transcriptional activator
MEIWQLNTFNVVAKHMHFTKASKELNLTQSAVSYQIKSLEEELGVKLFSRENRRILLTSQGDRVLDYTKRLLHQVDVMRNEIEENSDSVKGTVKIVTVPRSLNNPFFKLQRSFETDNPGIELFFESVIASESVFENVRKGISDIGFTSQTVGLDDLLSIPYGRFELLFVVGKSHPLAKKKEVKLSNLQNERWILFEEGSWIRKKTDEIFSRQSFDAKLITRSNDGAMIFSMISDGAGIGFLPKWGILDGIKEGKVVPIKLKDVSNYIPVMLLIRPENHSKPLGLFVDYLLKNRVDGFAYDK